MLLKEVVRSRIEPELKAEATAVLERYGLDLSTAIRLFLRTVVAKQGISFALTPNADTIAAMAEADKLEGRLQSTDDLFEELETGKVDAAEKRPKGKAVKGAAAKAGKRAAARKPGSTNTEKSSKPIRHDKGVQKRQFAEAV